LPPRCTACVSCTSSESGSTLSATRNGRSTSAAEVGATATVGVPTVWATNVGAPAAAGACVAADPIVAADGVRARHAAMMPDNVETVAYAADDMTSVRPRARDLGLRLGRLAPGPLNALTDVPGTSVGHVSIVAGQDVRTGVTAIRTHPGDPFEEKTTAAAF